MKVYRYENEHGNGPYASSWDHRALLLKRHSFNPERPGPGTDFNGYIDMYDMFGCVSVEALREWFVGFNEYLIECGFVIKEYEVDVGVVSIGKSMKQLIFRRRGRGNAVTVFPAEGSVYGPGPFDACPDALLADLLKEEEETYRSADEDEKERAEAYEQRC